jgi:IS5 family transposase
VAGTKLRDRMRSTQRCLVHIGRASRSFRTDQGKQRLSQCYGRLLTITSRAVGQAKRFVREVQNGIKAGASVVTQAAVEAHRDYLQTMIPRVQQVMRQTRERLFQGNTRAPGKLVSLFEPHTEIIRKGKASKPTEFGKMVKIQEAEQQIVTHYRTTRFTTNGPATPTCWSRRSTCTCSSSAVRLA